MTKKSFQVSACWGGSQLGFRISPKDRACYFQDVTIIKLNMPKPKERIIIIDLSTKPSFWRECPKLIDKQTKKWLLDNGYQMGGEYWGDDNPPKFILTEVSKGEFDLTDNNKKESR